MPPKPAPDTRAAARRRVSDLKASRDQVHEDAEQTKRDADAVMWQAIAAEMDSQQLLQRDVAEVTGFSRDHVLRRTKKYRTAE